MNIDVDQLREEVQSRYKAMTFGDFQRYRSKRVPDFLDHDGVKLAKIGSILSADDLKQDLPALADQIVTQVVAHERELIAGRGPAEVLRCFLKGHELPDVARRPVDDAIKWRHVFAVVER